jgi:hypothetical protein
LYVVATGGNPGLAAGTDNAALALMAALGPCNQLDQLSHVVVNEVTTVAAVYALNAFVGAGTVQIGTSSTNTTGLSNSFLLVNNMVNLATGSALATTPAGNGMVPQATINTLADALAPCVNSDGTGVPCSSLFAATTSIGGTTPADTIQAILNVARGPANNVAAVYGLAGSTPPFQPTLSTVPNDWIVALKYGGGGLAGQALAIDAMGNVWVANSIYGGPYSVTEWSNNGTVLSGANGYSGGGLSAPTGIAIDPAGSAWVASATNVVKLSSSGAILSGSEGFTGGGLSAPMSISVDGGGNAWVVNWTSNSYNLVKLDTNGNVLSGANGFATGGVSRYGGVGVGIDTAGNVWAAGSGDTLIKFANDGTVLSGSGYSTGGVIPAGVAIDAAGNAWVNNPLTQGSVVFGEVSPSGALLSPSGGYPNCISPGVVGDYVISCLWWAPASFALDGAGNIWSEVEVETAENGRVPNPMYVGGVAEMSSTGTILSAPAGTKGSIGYTAGLATSPVALAIDGSGNVWMPMSGSYVLEFVGAGTPVVTPFSVGIKNGRLGNRP